jgi:hypothetical protein
MCTVIFSPRQRGYLLGMNRDEKRTRPVALPPSLHRAGSRQAIFPREPGGGTWIAANDLGISFALVNWYSIADGRNRGTISRGTVVKFLLECENAREASQTLGRLALAQMNPFRLIGFFPAGREIVEWGWNSKKLKRIHHPWKLSAWISSGYDEPGAQKTRGKIFSSSLDQKTSGSAAWLRRLHRSHQPKPGPYSICMHRDDAATVSYTEVQVGVNSAKMRYTAGAPCANATASLTILKCTTRCS